MRRSMCTPIRRSAASLRTVEASTSLANHPPRRSDSIDREQIKTRPVFAPARFSRRFPALLISQHSGEGKANQYYLRGFQLDHGTDLEATVAGVPINLPTHAHGQGYSDINWLMPELVSFVEYDKGPYYASTGDFATAGAYALSIGTPSTLRSASSVSATSVTITFSSPVRRAWGPAISSTRFRSTTTTDLSIARTSTVSSMASCAGATRRRRPISASRRWAITAPFSRATKFRIASSPTAHSTRTGSSIPLMAARPIATRFQPMAAYQTTQGITQINAFGFEQYLNLFSNFTYYLDDATDYYNVTRNPITCTIAYNTCDPGPRHLNSYVSYCPENNVPGAKARRPARSPRLLSSSPAATNASKKISASSRASISREPSTRMASRLRPPVSASATTTSRPSGSFSPTMRPVSRRHAQSRARRRTRQLRVDADAAARRVQAAAHARTARRSLQLQRRRASRRQLRRVHLRHRQPEVHGGVRALAYQQLYADWGEELPQQRRARHYRYGRPADAAPPTTRSASRCCKTRRSRAPRGLSSATATRAAVSTARFRCGSFI